jgi:uncharacterized protein (DUF1697 family)
VQTYVVLLRGINVGGKNILPMKELAMLLERLGYQNVRTYIQSGNVVLRSATRPGDEIAAEIETHYGFRPRICVIDADALAQASADNPFPEGEAKQVHFFFCHTPPDHPDTDRIEQLRAESERYALTNRVFYLYAPEGIGRSKLAAGVERCLGVPVTARNLRTVVKLLDIASS